jgi:Zn-dependent peptidase ImmA (M78 family)
MTGRYHEPRAHALRDAYHAVFAAAHLPVPVERIAEDYLGLRVRERGGLPVSGLLVPARREIWVNADDVPGRRRFTVAHELGHWVCQAGRGNPAPVFCRPQDLEDAADRALEREANVFAAELLMPEPALREEHDRLGAGEQLARRFGVSELALAWRLYNLGLTPERPAARPAGDDAT